MPISAPSCLGLRAKSFSVRVASGEQEVVDHGLMAPSQRSEFIGQGEGDHKILHRQQLLLLALKPSGSLIVLALGTTAVATRQRPPYGLVAGAAMDLQFTGRWRTTAEDGVDGVEMPG